MCYVVHIFMLCLSLSVFLFFMCCSLLFLDVSSFLCMSFFLYVLPSFMNTCVPSVATLFFLYCSFHLCSFFRSFVLHCFIYFLLSLRAFDVFSVFLMWLDVLCLYRPGPISSFDTVSVGLCVCVYLFMCARHSFILHVRCLSS